MFDPCRDTTSICLDATRALELPFDKVSGLYRLGGRYVTFVTMLGEVRSGQMAGVLLRPEPKDGRAMLMGLLVCARSGLERTPMLRVKRASYDFSEDDADDWMDKVSELPLFWNKLAAKAPEAKVPKPSQPEAPKPSQPEASKPSKPQAPSKPKAPSKPRKTLQQRSEENLLRREERNLARLLNKSVF